MNKKNDKAKSVNGLFIIGDPHIEGRKPNFRCDDYPRVILDKIRWCLDYSTKHKLLPVFLGDMFEKPRDNPTWMLGELIEMMINSDCIGIYGNHDCAEPQLTENDSLMILIKAGCLRLVSKTAPWVGEVNGRRTVVGGSSYREDVPASFDLTSLPQSGLFDETPLVVWLTHHDVEVGTYEGGRFKPSSIENVQLLVNGHIHRRMDPVQAGETLWMTPGNISRRSRHDAVRRHAPAALLVRACSESDHVPKFETEYIEVPHQPSEKIFLSAVADSEDDLGPSGFIAGLKELQQTKTESGAGLHEFLQKNVDQFPDPVADEIMALATEVASE